ncbi:response regulator [Lysinibacillus contaminans]|uniref:Response regulator n=1 Tax=Lysinibacillus contaminans TaxID=1293441 RepID=A0ABR5K3B5_9BACI|nr:SpoIIE family protein phosphatase [Lysinibacillus contaminans]KOS69263.1 response regulator [Lysinibacillus contaminans]
MSVLIIGNVSNDVLRTKKYFNRIGIINVHSFSTVDAVMNYISDVYKEDIDLIIFDVKLTLTNCEEICQQIEILNNWIQVPILLSTSYEKTIIIDRVFDAGIFDFILKPFDFTQFKARVHVALKYREEAKLRKQQESSQLKDLAIAKKVQKNAFTPSLKLEHIEFDGLYVTSNTLGGDMYCWFKINDDLTAVLLYDVMGHGIAASLVTMSIRSLLRGLITRLIDPVCVITELNRRIYELFSDEDMDSFLVTAIYILIDTKNGTLHYINASHPPGLLFGKYGETVLLQPNTPILGLFPTIQINKKSIQLSGWHRIILYTDGMLALTENQTVDLNYFHSYASQDNAYALQKFSQKYDLFENNYTDDITVVSITITL